MLTSYRHGALHVVAQQQAPAQITKDLRQIDDRLFVEKQLTLSGEEVWCVVVDVGGDQPPFTILEWRDERSGQPIPELSSGIVARVHRMERDGKRLHGLVVVENRRRVEASRRAAAHAYEEMARDMEPRASGLRSAVLPRSQALRMSRDRARAQGRKV